MLSGLGRFFFLQYLKKPYHCIAGIILFWKQEQKKPAVNNKNWIKSAMLCRNYVILGI